MKKLNTFLQPDGSYQYSIWAPDVVVDREERPHYEKDRFASMEANLKKGDVLFDVGSELGWQSAIYAKFVGPENVCLFEPHPELWPVIHEIWMMNYDVPPLLTWPGFVSNRTTAHNEIRRWSWPLSSRVDLLPDLFERWSEIHASTNHPEIRLSDVVEETHVTPAAVTIDVEGAELRVLRGSHYLLRCVRPLFWVSVHPRIRLEKFDGATKERIFELFESYDYRRQYLGVDHEEHYFFYPAERVDRVALVDSPWMTHGKRDMTFEEAIPDWQDVMGMPYATAWGGDA